MINIKNQIETAHKVKADIENYINGNKLASEYRCQLGASSCENCPLNENETWKSCNDSHDKPGVRLLQIKSFLKENTKPPITTFGSEIVLNGNKRLKGEIDRKENLILDYQKELINLSEKLQDKTLKLFELDKYKEHCKEFELEIEELHQDKGNLEEENNNLCDENSYFQEIVLSKDKQIEQLENNLKDWYDFQFEVSLDCLPWPIVKSVFEYEKEELQTTEEIAKQVWVWRDNIVAGNAKEGEVCGKYFTVFKNKVIFTYSCEE